MEPQTDNLEPRLVRIPVAARALDISESTLFRLIEAGDIATVRFGRVQRVPVSEIDRLVATRLVRNGGTP